MFGFIIDQLKLYIPKAEKIPNQTVDALKSNRADQLELDQMVIHVDHVYCVNNKYRKIHYNYVHLFSERVLSILKYII